MEVIVNNKIISIPLEYKLADLLNHLNLNKSVAVFINGQQLLYAEYDYYKLQEMDTIKIIRPFGGG